MKKLSIFLFSIIILNYMVIPNSAFYNTQLGSFVEIIHPFYSGNSDCNYYLYNSNGEDITDKFYNLTNKLAENYYWNEIFDIYQNQVEFIKTEKTVYKSLRSGDIAKTVTSQSYRKKLTPISGYNYNQFNYIYLNTQMIGTIYYNPNTYKINNNSFRVSYANLEGEDGNVQINPGRVSISSNGLTATYPVTYRCNVPLDEGGMVFTVIDFASESISFSITAG